jgi:hypothetical protein
MASSVSSQPAEGVVYRPLSAFRARFPGARANAALHLSTLIRWCTRGIRMPDGSRVRLRGIRAGSRWLTTDTWVDEFVTALTTAHTGGEVASAPRPPARRQRESEAAGRELTQRYGIKSSH